MAKPTYQIKDWDKHFENHESRKLKRSYWVPIPNRHDGKSFRRIAAHPEGVAVFAAWTLMLEVASKMPTRGILADEDGPLDSEDLAAMTGFPAAIFDSAFNLLTQQKFGWLTCSQSRVKIPKSPEISRNLPKSPDVSGKTAAEWNGIEGNGTTGNGKERPADAEVVLTPFSGSLFLSTLSDFEQHRKEIKKPLKPTGRAQLYRQLEQMGEVKAIAAMKRSIASGWQGVFEENGNGTTQQRNGYETAAEKRGRNFRSQVEFVNQLRRESLGSDNEGESGTNAISRTG